MLKMMFKWIIGAALLASAPGVAQAQAKPKGNAKASAKASAKPRVIVCPVTDEEAAPSPEGSVKLNGETVYFCCPGCREQFAKMSPAQKKARFARAKQLAAKANARPKKSS